MRILVTDDSSFVRRAVVEILKSVSGLEICGEASNATEALNACRSKIPDLVLLDISMPGMSGLEAARLLRGEHPKLKILIMSQHDPVALLPYAISMGADGCLDKADLARRLVPAIRELSVVSAKD